MADAVAFVFATWIGRYPEFVAVPEGAAQSYFEQAAIYWRNDGTSPATKAATQKTLMYLVTAHLAALYSQSQGAPSPGSAQDANSPIGRISSATQGSVTVQTDIGMTPTTSAQQAFFSQTKYGLQFWAATAQYRTGRYRLGNLQPGGLSPGWRGRPVY